MGHTLKKYCHGAWIVKKARFISHKYRALHKAIGWQNACWRAAGTSPTWKDRKFCSFVRLLIPSFFKFHWAPTTKNLLACQVLWLLCEPQAQSGVSPQKSPLSDEDSPCRRAFFFYSNFPFFEGTSHYSANTWSLLPERAHTNTCILLPPFSAQSTLWFWRSKQLALSLNSSYDLTSGWTIFSLVLLGSFTEI